MEAKTDCLVERRQKNRLGAEDRRVCFQAATYHFLYTRGTERSLSCGSRGSGSPFCGLPPLGPSVMFILDGKTERGRKGEKGQWPPMEREMRGMVDGGDERCCFLAWTPASTLPFYTYLLACIIARAQCSFILCSALVGHVLQEVTCSSLMLSNDPYFMRSTYIPDKQQIQRQPKTSWQARVGTTAAQR